MYGILKDIIAYTGTQINNADQYYLYGSIVLTVIITVVFLDLLYRLLRSFVRK